MNLGTRIGRMESASGSNAPVVQLTAIDEADLRQKFEDLLLTMKPGPVVIEALPVPTHEERLELHEQETGTNG